MQNIHDSHEAPDFSIVLGGATFQLLVRSKLTTGALELLHRRILFISLFAWLPMFFLSAFQGTLWSGVGMPYLYDIEMHARFLVALPLLIFAELLVHKRMRVAVGQFTERGIIQGDELPKFKEIIASAMRLRNSVTIELILFIFVFVAGHFIWSTMSGMDKLANETGSWYAMTVNNDTRLSLAGYWYVFVSRPIFQFILIRWYFRVFIWARFLWQTSRLKLNLIPIHPDRAAGLGFLGGSSEVFAPLLMANGAAVAGLISNHILYSGAKLTDFQLEILGLVAFQLFIVLGPLMAFTPTLMKSKRSGLHDYGIFACKYTTEFDRKWVLGGAPDDEQLLGSGDIQSLADLGNSFQVIREIKPVPFSRDTVVHLVISTLLPGLPLIFTIIPIEQLISKLLGSIF